MTEEALDAEKARSELTMFVGTWTIKGSEDSYRETVAWLPGGGFIACDAEDNSPDGGDYSHSVMGYSAAEGVYTHVGFHRSGSYRSLRGTLRDGVWRFFGQSERGPNWRRYLATISPSAEGYSFVEEVSDRGGPWRISVERTFLRLE